MRCQLNTNSGMHFFIVFKQLTPTNWKPVYKSEIKPFLNNCFEWSQFSVLTTDITTDNNVEQEFKIEFFRNEKSGQHKNVGAVNMSLAQVRLRQLEYTFQGAEKNTSGKLLLFTQLELKQRHSFLEYVFGGCEIGLSVAIDFTMSNGDP